MIQSKDIYRLKTILNSHLKHVIFYWLSITAITMCSFYFTYIFNISSSLVSLVIISIIVFSKTYFISLTTLPGTINLYRKLNSSNISWSVNNSTRVFRKGGYMGTENVILKVLAVAVDGNIIEIEPLLGRNTFDIK